MLMVEVQENDAQGQAEAVHSPGLQPRGAT